MPLQKGTDGGRGGGCALAAAAGQYINSAHHVSSTLQTTDLGAKRVTIELDRHYSAQEIVTIHRLYMMMYPEENSFELQGFTVANNKQLLSLARTVTVVQARQYQSQLQKILQQCRSHTNEGPWPAQGELGKIARIYSFVVGYGSNTPRKESSVVQSTFQQQFLAQQRTSYALCALFKILLAMILQQDAVIAYDTASGAYFVLHTYCGMHYITDVGCDVFLKEAHGPSFCFFMQGGTYFRQKYDSAKILCQCDVQLAQDCGWTQIENVLVFSERTIIESIVRHASSGRSCFILLVKQAVKDCAAFLQTGFGNYAAQNESNRYYELQSCVQCQIGGQQLVIIQITEKTALVVHISADAAAGHQQQLCEQVCKYASAQHGVVIEIQLLAQCGTENQHVYRDCLQEIARCTMQRTQYINSQTSMTRVDEQTAIFRMAFRRREGATGTQLEVRNRAHYTHYTEQFANKELLHIVIDACYAMQRTVDVPEWVTATVDDVNTLKYVLAADYPEFWYISLNMASTCTVNERQFVRKLFLIDRKYSAKVIQDMNRQVLGVVDAFIAKNGSNKPLEVERLAHNFITHNVKYKKVDPEKPYEFSQNIIGCILRRQCVCQGIALAFKYFCDALSIECLCVTGMLGKRPHMWNMVRIEGEFYHVDATADLTDMDYVCFNVNDRLIYADRTGDTTFSRPQSGEGLEYNFYAAKKLCVRNASTVTDETVDILVGRVGAAQQGEVSITLLYDIGGFNAQQWVKQWQYEIGIRISKKLGRLITVCRYCIKQGCFIRFTMQVHEEAVRFQMPMSSPLDSKCIYVLATTAEDFVKECRLRNPPPARLKQFQLAQHGEYLLVKVI